MANDPVKIEASNIGNIYGDSRTPSVVLEVKDNKQELLNQAISLLMEAVNSEDGADAGKCVQLASAMQGQLEIVGRTSDYYRNMYTYDRLCAAMGVSNGDEIDILPLVEKALAERKIK